MFRLAWIRRSLGLCCLALVVASVGCRQDSAQWKVAAGNNAAAAGNSEEAIELFQEALRMDPDSDSIKLRLAYLLAANDQGDLGLTLCNEVLESDPRDKYALRVRSECLQYLGRFQEALVDYQKFAADKIDKGTRELNALAYYRALAGYELDKAYRQIDTAIGKYESRHWGGFSNVPIEVSSVVSAALVSRHTDEGHHLVMDLLGDMIHLEQQRWLLGKTRLDSVIDAQEDSDDDINEVQVDRQQVELNQAAKQSESLAGNLMILLAARSLILEDQGQFELADLDRLWLKRINYQPEELYNRLPGDNECLAALLESQNYLDTRGFVLTQLPWQPTWTHPSGKVTRMFDRKSLVSYGSYARALHDLDIAVTSAEMRLLALNSDVFNRMERPVDAIRHYKVSETKVLAVLLSHRREAHLKAGQSEAAERDLLRIQELGFEADSNLF